MPSSFLTSYLFVGALLFIGCTPTPDLTDPQYIVDKAIESHGSMALSQAVLEFDYRDKHFIAQRNNGLFSYERIYTDSTGHVREVLNNDEVFKEINGKAGRTNRKETLQYPRNLKFRCLFWLCTVFFKRPSSAKEIPGRGCRRK